MLRPLRDGILVRPLERKASDIIMVVNSDKPNLGEIAAIGPKAEDVKVGDRIRFGTAENYLSFPEWLDNDGTRYLVMRDDDVCFVEDAA